MALCHRPSCVWYVSLTETSRDRVKGTEKQIVLRFLHAQRALCAHCIPSSTEQRWSTHRLASRHQGKHHNYPRDTGGNLAYALLLQVVVLMSATYFFSYGTTWGTSGAKASWFILWPNQNSLQSSLVSDLEPLMTCMTHFWSSMLTLVQHGTCLSFLISHIQCSKRQSQKYYSLETAVGQRRIRLYFIFCCLWHHLDLGKPLFGTVRILF